MPLDLLLAIVAGWFVAFVLILGWALCVAAKDGDRIYERIAPDPDAPRHLRRVES